MPRSRFLLIPFLVVMGFALGTGPGASGAPPTWFLEHLERQMQHGGRTRADNAEYRSPEEPFDGYGIEWEWGIGRQSLRGRLFAIRDELDVGDMWELRTLWHPGENEAHVLQFGADGTFASGWMRPLEDGATEMEQTFIGPDGALREVRHESYPLEDGGHAGGSFAREGDGWKVERQYTWLPFPQSKAD